MSIKNYIDNITKLEQVDESLSSIQKMLKEKIKQLSLEKYTSMGKDEISSRKTVSVISSELGILTNVVDKLNIETETYFSSVDNYAYIYVTYNIEYKGNNIQGINITLSYVYDGQTFKKWKLYLNSK